MKFKLLTSHIKSGKRQSELLEEIFSLLERSWGRFDKEFVHKHIFSSPGYLSLAYEEKRLVGFCCVTTRPIMGKKVNYIEFTVVDPKFQGLGLGPKLTYFALKKEILAMVTMRKKYVEIMLLTPNIRVLGKLSKLSKFIYPNPYSSNSSGDITEADDETWKMAKQLIEDSDNPNREIDRKGLVLHGSYRDTPWLIYKGEGIPWHRDEKLNIFARKYLGYGKGEDKEFIVRSVISVSSLTRSIFSKRW